MRVSDGLAAGYLRDAAELVFEYMAATQVEGGRPEPANVSELPAVLRRECEDLAGCYAAPGALFVAYQGEHAAGCVGVAPGPSDDAAEVKRLYVRPAYRGHGAARLLMGHAHRHAGRQGFTRLVLDVMPNRSPVIGFYRRLGYVECEPFAAGSSFRMVSMQRPL